MKRIIITLAAASTLLVGSATGASATGGNPHVDPCPGQHVQVWSEVGNSGRGQATNHFVCGPIQGEPGPAGPQGPAGPAGPQGEKGDTGEQGPQGETGPIGPEGPKGDKGDTGEKGDRGFRGFRGKTGLPGLAGPTGPAGEVGPAGPEGPTGPAGPAGKDGASGSDGASGRDGVDGRNGTDGMSADQSEIANLRAVVTELNNRLFILEHTDAPVAAPEAPATPVVTGELPRTGNSTAAVLGIAGSLFFLGAAFRFLARR